jgi:L-ascorbate metabolism protein UlaG (beta-lactamase superfamily)
MIAFRLAAAGAASALAFLFVASSAAMAQAEAGRCLAVAEAAAKVVPVAYVAVQDGLVRPSTSKDEVTIRFVGHSTFLITTPDGVTIATDYDGYAGPSVVPRVVTMNHAHPSHYTDTPDPRIEYVLRGWGENGTKAEHHLQVGDVYIRNVTTDIRDFSGGRIPDGNSIFIFETARLCIGHLGHLHHMLAPEDLAFIGQLDVVMAAVDGSMTMDVRSMLQTLKVLKARLVLPMHYFGPDTLRRFLSVLGEDFEVELSRTPEIVVSAATLPERPTVLVLPGH